MNFQANNPYFILLDVWRYFYANNSWKKVGNLLNPRSQHVALTGTGLKCP